MNSQSDKLPRLRFPEFRDAGTWEEKRLGDVAAFSKGKGISKADISPNGSQPCIRYGELYTHYQETIDVVVSHTNLPPESLVLSQANDVIIPASGETQIDIATASCVVQSGIALGGDLNIIRSEMNGVFLSYYLNGAKKTDIAEKAQGISVVHLYPNQLTTLKIGIPKPPEQQKIANCLTSIDDLITAQVQKLIALKTHKKGMMQQLFPAEGKTMPNLRFPEFRDAGEWEVEELREVAEFANHRASISEIPLEQFVSTESLLPDYAGIKLATKLPPTGTAILFKKGDILISNIRPYLRKVWFSNKSGGTSNDVIVVRASTTGFSRYLSFVLINDGFINYVMEGAKGVKMPRGDIEQIKKFPVVFPKEKEQQKIAACLTSLDDLITAQAQKLDGLKAHKKGLIQQLFPASDGVSG